MTYHQYLFFTIRPAFHDLSSTKRKTYKAAFLKELQKEKTVIVYTYAMVGLKADATMLLWIQSDSLESNQDFLNRLLHTDLGTFLGLHNTLFGMTRPTQYSPASSSHLDTRRKGGAYLTIYPFIKTHAWYQLSMEQRKELMKGHIAIGRKYPQITQLLLYSYGVDDSEFIVSYEMDDLPAFQSLVISLRSDKVRAYTLKDTPIYTCIYKSFEEVLDYI